jgi:transcriptional regulator with GAF, ATPase, and Fis domain/serine/threonine protein kinase
MPTILANPVSNASDVMRGSPLDVNEVDDLPARFRHPRVLGTGAEGGALCAVDEATGAPVVLKRVEATRLSAVRHAFEVLRSVASPHLPAVRELVRAPRAGAGTWLVTDWVEGHALGAGPVCVAEAAAEALAVAHALAAIHAAGTHHGDVSPGNVVVTSTRGVVLIDLGHLGRLGTGTPGYIAPEVLAGGGGPAADRFALGCLLAYRLFGETPWRRPEDLLAVADTDAVRRRLESLARSAVPRMMVSLLERLLAPDPSARPPSTGLVVERLARIVSAAQAGIDLRPPTTWWIPARWPYRGPSLEPVARILDETSPRIVAVSGPPGSGRGRVVEELVQELQARGRSASLWDPRPSGRGSIDPATWLEAWTTSVSEEAPAVLGVSAPLEFPTLEREGASEQVRGALAVLRSGLDATGPTMIVSVPRAIGEALRRLAHPRIVVHETRAWSVQEVREALDPVLEGHGRQAWAEALARVTGGQPASVVRAASVCAEAGLEQPRIAEIERALATAGSPGPRLEVTTARALVQACWTPETFDPRILPDHLHDGTAPLPAAIAAARETLADDLAELARATLEEVRELGRTPSLLLAVDADAAAEVDALAREIDVVRPGRRGATAFVQWLRTGAVSRVKPWTRALGARLLLAEGDAHGALEIARTGEVSPDSAVEEARALQRLGRIDEAMHALGRATTEGDEALRAAALGLRWRLLVDAGEAEQAVNEAEAWSRDAASGTGTGMATACLWSAYALTMRGEVEQAEARLAQAEAALDGCRSVVAAGISARVTQLRGNVAHDRGDLRGAYEAWSRAAESFARAGETIGELGLRGSLAALAIPMADTRRGIEHGRIAVRGLLARGQISSLETAALALVQLLGRVGALDEATVLVSIVEDATASRAQSELRRARLARMRAELAATALVLEVVAGAAPRHVSDRRREAEDAHVHAARLLDRADAPREALEAWVRATTLARAGDRFAAARAHLAQAHSALGAVDDEGSSLAVWLESTCLAAVTEDHEALRRAEDALLELPRGSALSHGGALELAWAHDRALALAARVRLPPRDPQRRALARRAIATLEAIMKKTPELDRPAVRASFAVDAGQTGALRELLADLDGAEPEARESVPPARQSAPTQAARLERLLRIYRRLAREDRLEPLLEHVVDAVMDLTDAERGAVVLRADGDARLEVTRELAGTEGAKFSRSVIERVLESGEAVLSVDAAQDERFDASRSISHLNLRSVLAVPLSFRGEPLGAIYVDHRLRRGNFGDDDLAHMEAFADLAALAVAHARALSEVRAQAHALEAKQAELTALLEAREVEVAGLREEVRASVPERKAYRGIVGATTAMQRVFRLIDRLADSDVPVVIHGESGTGKELVARAIHEAGSRSQGPFVAENCGAIPESLLESVLFGHAKGAFTGAQKARAGLFEAANEGTIFLDEVGEMSPGMQTKLLRVLQEGEVKRIGETSARRVDVRVIAASNRDLDVMVEQGTFRKDLYYRINVVRLDLPALRERPADIAELVRQFVERHAGGRKLDVEPAAMRALRSYAWPGNVRELENEVQRWVALCEGTVTLDDLSPAILGRNDESVDPDDLRIRPRVERLERELIERALESTEGNQTRAAELLGLSRYGLQKKLRRLTEEG